MLSSVPLHSGRCPQFARTLTSSWPFSSAQTLSIFNPLLGPRFVRIDAVCPGHAPASVSSSLTSTSTMSYRRHDPSSPRPPAFHHIDQYASRKPYDLTGKPSQVGNVAHRAGRFKVEQEQLPNRQTLVATRHPRLRPETGVNPSLPGNFPEDIPMYNVQRCTRTRCAIPTGASSGTICSHLLRFTLLLRYSPQLRTTNEKGNFAYPDSSYTTRLEPSY